MKIPVCAKTLTETKHNCLYNNLQSLTLYKNKILNNNAHGR